MTSNMIYCHLSISFTHTLYKNTVGIIDTLNFVLTHWECLLSEMTNIDTSILIAQEDMKSS